MGVVPDGGKDVVLDGGSVAAEPDGGNVAQVPGDGNVAVMPDGSLWRQVCVVGYDAQLCLCAAVGVAGCPSPWLCPVRWRRCPSC